MGIDDYFLVIILVAGFALSGLQKLVERMKASRRSGEDRATDARRNAGDSVRTAQRRAAAGRPAQTQPVKIEDVIRRLMGEESAPTFEGPTAENDEAAESDWTPLSPPPIRRAPAPAPPQRVPATPPRQMHQPPPRRQVQMPQRPMQQPPPTSARPIRQRPARSPAEMVAQPRHARRESEEPMPIEIEQRENERRWREEMERRNKQQAAQQKQRQPEVLHTLVRLQPSGRRLFHSAGEVRRAFILSEVLGPPRATRDIEERS